MTPDLLDQGVRDAIAAGADEAELSFVGKTFGASRFANSYLTQSGVVSETLTRVRVNLGGRLGAAVTGAQDRASLAQAARRAIEIAGHQPKRDFPGFARNGEQGGGDDQDGATAAFTPAERADALAQLFAHAAAHDLVCAGSFSTGTREQAVATSTGVSRRWIGTHASLSIIALDLAADVSGYAAFHGPSIEHLDPRALAEEAVDKAVRARDPIELAPGAYDVILSPHAVAELLEWMVIASFTGRAVLDGTSFLAGNLGESICDERISIVDDVAHDRSRATAPPFDAEGTPTRRIALVDRGRGGPPLSDLSTAAKLGAPSTGHAPPLGVLLADGPLAANLVMLPGADTPSELLARVDKGLLVTRFHYVNGLLDTRRATMTGMTRDGAFLVEHGRVGRAVKNLRFTDSILDAWSPSRLAGIGRELVAVAGSWTGYGATLCPSLLLRGFHFTGRSR